MADGLAFAYADPTIFVQHLGSALANPTFRPVVEALGRLAELRRDLLTDFTYPIKRPNVFELLTARMRDRCPQFIEASENYRHAVRYAQDIPLALREFRSL